MKSVNSEESSKQTPVVIYIRREGTELGRYSQSTVELLLTVGRLKPSDLARVAGSTNWMSLRDLIDAAPDNSSAEAHIPIHVSRFGASLGSFSQADIAAKLRFKELLLSDMAWAEGMTEWRPLSDFIVRPDRHRAAAECEVSAEREGFIIRDDPKRPLRRAPQLSDGFIFFIIGLALVGAGFIVGGFSENSPLFFLIGVVCLVPMGIVKSLFDSSMDAAERRRLQEQQKLAQEKRIADFNARVVSMPDLCPNCESPNFAIYTPARPVLLTTLV